MASSMIMTLVIFFQLLSYFHLLHKPMVSTEIPSSPNGQVKISYWYQYRGHYKHFLFIKVNIASHF